MNIVIEFVQSKTLNLGECRLAESGYDRIYCISTFNLKLSITHKKNKSLYLLV